MRKSGILMHITSLPSPYGIGSVGKCAYDFVDFLCDAGQTYWQILPLSPTGYGDSPYQAFSTFAGNHYLIDLDMLIEEGLLEQEEVDAVCWSKDENRVDFGCLYAHRSKLLRRAYARFTPDEAFHKFVRSNADWLEDYALFMALKESFRGKAWQNWSVSLMMRLPSIMESYRAELADSIQFQYYLQYTFFRQWGALRRYANEKVSRLSAMCQSMFRWILPMSGQIRICSSWMATAVPNWLQAARRIRSRQMVSSGAIPCMTGMP